MFLEEALQRGTLHTLREVNIPANFAAEVVETPLNSLVLLFTGLGLYSLLGISDAAIIL